jgi:hypothetical protein
VATFLELYQSLDNDPLKRGKQFERFTKWLLKNDPEWSTQVDQVWLWEEYPERWVSIAVSIWSSGTRTAKPGQFKPNAIHLTMTSPSTMSTSSSANPIAKASTSDC